MVLNRVARKPPGQGDMPGTQGLAKRVPGMQRNRCLCGAVL